MKWIVTANTNQCRIYDYEQKSHELKLIKEINSPKSKLKTSELVAGKPGRYKARGPIGGTYTQETLPEEVQINKFARAVASELDEARNHHDYDELVFIMAPEMDGLLLHHLNKNVKAMIKKNIQKNMMHLNQNELLDYLNEKLKRFH
ncbi:Protein required for attachment to host cells [Legionella lansingensis]|uniref:Protein required for attachment to host cells n=1 Tax=Legionella lansingensis TaxID=45067 RepID=A0A0W0VU10_9GAMM|nr:host attachment protein [Legionella lansingensis]KTD23477.1 hypothetical protein Llan_0848 [Legionella lansingensis]SNV50788.1 Protein required for attachment to host cells [Legionella lansingensis]